jgi:antitoxin (DNA-binding transcriptional repressor) of toxin-antitoxin stability system
MDLRRSLGAILDAASAGERIVIERDHRPLAVLISPEDAGRFDEEREERIRRRLAAVEVLEAFSRRMAQEHPRRPGDPDSATLVRRMRHERADHLVRVVDETAGRRPRSSRRARPERGPS